MLAALTAVMLEDMRLYNFFSEPVDPVRLSLPEYTSLVKNPMDLGTVHGRLLGGVYESVHAVTRDVRQVWSNAQLYWRRGSRGARAAEALAGKVTRAADHLEGLFDKCLASGSVPDWRDAVRLRSVFRLPACGWAITKATYHRATVRPCLAASHMTCTLASDKVAKDGPEAHPVSPRGKDGGAPSDGKATHGDRHCGAQ